MEARLTRFAVWAQEYDLYCKLTPHQVRPIADQFGDRRRGAQLLAEYARDRQLRISELARTGKPRPRFWTHCAHLWRRSLRKW
eukprot:929257-Rhodomonas_salina.4